MIYYKWCSNHVGPRNPLTEYGNICKLDFQKKKKKSDYFSLQADIVLKHSQMKKILIL